MQCNVSQERAFLEKYENLEDFVSGGGKGDWREFTIVIQEEGLQLKCQFLEVRKNEIIIKCNACNISKVKPKCLN